MSLDLDLTGINIDDLNIANWQPPKNKHQGYKDAVSYAVTKDREAREQRIEDSRAKLYARMSPQQRALLEAVANQATGGGVLDLKQGPDAHLEGLADTWAKHAGAMLEPLFNGDQNEAPFSDLSSETDPAEMVTAGDNGVGDLTRTGTSHDWDKAPHAMEQKRHTLSDIDEEHRQAYCAAHAHRVRIDQHSVVNGKQYWRCCEQDVYRHQGVRPGRALGTYTDASQPKCCGNGGECPNCPFI